MQSDRNSTTEKSVSNFARREELIGWVRGNEPANAAALAEEVARLAKENTELRQQYLMSQGSPPPMEIAGLFLAELSLLKSTDKGQSNEEYALALNWDGKTHFRGFNLSKRDLSDLEFREADFISAILCETFLENVDLSHAKLTRANLEGATLQNATLQDADLRGANLQGAVLQGAVLQDADLRGAVLQDAVLQGANLQGAVLQDANLQGAVLQGAVLSGAVFSDANLQGADLQDAVLQGADLRSARYNRSTRWPDGFASQELGAIPRI